MHLFYIKESALFEEKEGSLQHHLYFFNNTRHRNMRYFCWPFKYGKRISRNSLFVYLCKQLILSTINIIIWEDSIVTLLSTFRFYSGQNTLILGKSLKELSFLHSQNLETLLIYLWPYNAKKDRNG